MQAPAVSQLVLPPQALSIHRLFNASLRRRETDGARPVTFAAFFALFPSLLAMIGIGAPGEHDKVRSLLVEDQLVLRVPVRPPPPQVEWIEKKGPKCIDAGAIRGAFLSGEDHVDFLLSGRRLLRAKLADDCPALDFYDGFYLSSVDEQICIKRDVVRSRMGGTCEIRRFRTLQPKHG